MNEIEKMHRERRRERKKFDRYLERAYKRSERKDIFLAGVDFYRDRMTSTFKGIVFAILNFLSKAAIFLTIVFGAVVVFKLFDKGLTKDIFSTASFILFAVSAITGFLTTVLMSFFVD